MASTVTKAAAMIPVILAAAMFFGAIALDVALVRRWRGAWRILALLPLVALVLWAGFIVVGVAQDPTSHNLWPFELILWAAGAFAALGLLALIKRITKSA